MDAAGAIGSSRRPFLATRPVAPDCSHLQAERSVVNSSQDNAMFRRAWPFPRAGGTLKCSRGEDRRRKFRSQENSATLGATAYATQPLVMDCISSILALWGRRLILLSRRIAARECEGCYDGRRDFFHDIFLWICDGEIIECKAIALTALQRQSSFRGCRSSGVRRRSACLHTLQSVSGIE